LLGRTARASAPRPRHELLLLEDVDEDDHEQQVDEVHGLHQTHRQEEVLTRLVLNLGLTRDRRDGLATGQAVADRRTDSATAEGEAATDECTGASYRVRNACICQFVFPPGLG
jgi:hypothetical protein